MEEKQRREEMELDYLAPFFAQIGSSSEGEKGGGTLTEPQARKMKEDALADLKQRLIDKANLIQARFEKVRFFHLGYFWEMVSKLKFKVSENSILFTYANYSYLNQPFLVCELEIFSLRPP